MTGRILHTCPMSLLMYKWKEMWKKGRKKKGGFGGQTFLRLPDRFLLTYQSLLKETAVCCSNVKVKVVYCTSAMGK